MDENLEYTFYDQEKRKELQFKISNYSNNKPIGKPTIFLICQPSAQMSHFRVYC